MNETLDVRRLKALERQWEDEPPVNLLVASYLGYKKKERKAPTPASQEQAIEELFNMFPGGDIR